MPKGPFDLRFDNLPERLPIFPLAGALLLPRCRLPLNIFEPRYLAMVDDALRADRMLGMVQPHDATTTAEATAIFGTGCAGRITSFTETDDGRYLIILTGVARFDVDEELDVGTPYRQVRPLWQPYRDDLEEDDYPVDRERLYETLRAYFEAKGLDTDWEALDDSGDERLVNSLAMSCPFDAGEKQALLEADGVAERLRLMLSLMEMSVLSSRDDATRTH